MRTRCLSRSAYPAFRNFPRSSGSNSVRCFNQSSADAELLICGRSWKRCYGSRVQLPLGDSSRSALEPGRPWFTITVGGANLGSGHVFFRFCFPGTSLLRPASLFPLPNRLSGAVVLRACVGWQSRLDQKPARASVARFFLRSRHPVERLAWDAVLSQKEAQLGGMFLHVAQSVQLELEKTHRLPPSPGESHLALRLLI